MRYYILLFILAYSINTSAQGKRIIGDYKLEVIEDIILSDYDIFTPGLPAITSDNKLVLFDFNLYKLFVYNSDLTNYQSFGSKGRGPKEFGQIFDIDVNSKGEILLLDTSNNKIIKVDANGTFKKEIPIGSGSIRPLRFTICDQNSIMYILSFQNSKDGFLHQYDNDGKLKKSFSKTKIKGLEFAYHTDGRLDCDDAGNLYYATLAVNEIKKYNANGELIYNMPVFDSVPNEKITERDGKFVSLNPSATRFSGNIYYIDGKLYVSYSGEASYSYRYIDVYNEERQEYLYSIQFPYKFQRFVITKDKIAILREDENEESYLTVYKYSY
ncbi:MAG: 6-bladed beta-propeller [Balneolaceae bacterium]